MCKTYSCSLSYQPRYRVLALCHISTTGLVSPDPYAMDSPYRGECHDLRFLNVTKTVHAIQSDLASADPFCVGVKVRLSKAVSNKGANSHGP